MKKRKTGKGFYAFSTIHGKPFALKYFRLKESRFKNAMDVMYCITGQMKYFSLGKRIFDRNYWLKQDTKKKKTK